MREFDEALDQFRRACLTAAQWKNFFGAAYRTRLDTAFDLVHKAYKNACVVDDRELGREAPASKASTEEERVVEAARRIGYFKPLIEYRGDHTTRSMTAYKDAADAWDSALAALDTARKAKGT